MAPFSNLRNFLLKKPKIRKKKAHLQVNLKEVITRVDVATECMCVCERGAHAWALTYVCRWGREGKVRDWKLLPD